MICPPPPTSPASQLGQHHVLSFPQNTNMFFTEGLSACCSHCQKSSFPSHQPRLTAWSPPIYHTGLSCKVSSLAPQCGSDYHLSSIFSSCFYVLLRKISNTQKQSISDHQLQQLSISGQSCFSYTPSHFPSSPTLQHFQANPKYHTISSVYTLVCMYKR